MGGPAALGGAFADWGSGDERRILSANVSERVAGDVGTGVVVFVGGCSAAAVDGCANGLNGADEDDDEKGFALADRLLLVNGFFPNILAPRSCLGAVVVVCSCTAPLEPAGTESDPDSVCLNFLVARSALMLPGFRLHALLGHPKMYSLLSSSGKCSGRSPFNSRSRDIGRLQTLQLARWPGGGVLPSSHVYMYAHITVSRDQMFAMHMMQDRNDLTYRPASQMADIVVYDFL